MALFDGRLVAVNLVTLLLALPNPGWAASHPSQPPATQPPSTGAPRPAADGPALRIGCIDLRFVAANSNYGKAASARLRERAQEAQAAIATRAKALEAQQASLAQAAAASDGERREQERAFEKGRLEFERFRQDAQGELTAFADQLERELREKLFPVVDTISKEQGLHFVFASDSPGLVWFSATVDLSAEVVKRMDTER